MGHPYVGIANMGKSGRGLFATNDISEGTTLFHYNKTLHFGENLRNYGSYMQHAPQAEELEAYNLEFKTTEQPKIATQNSELKKKGEELIAVATKNIKKNEILVHSYQHNYWINMVHRLRFLQQPEKPSIQVNFYVAILGSVYISTMLAKKRRLAVLRCSHISTYAALRCSPNQRFLSQPSEM